MLYLVIREGNSPETARPLAVIRDPVVIKRVVEALRERLLEAGREADAPSLRLLKRAVEQQEDRQ